MPRKLFSDIRPYGVMLASVIAATALLTPLTGCVSHDYVGETNAPTTSVRVFYDASQIPGGYRVVGEDRAEAVDELGTQAVVADMVKKAREVGADAIAIEGVDTRITGTSTTASGQERTKSNSEFFVDDKDVFHTRHTTSGEWTSAGFTHVQRDKIVTAKFLKAM